MEARWRHAIHVALSGIASSTCISASPRRCARSEATPLLLPHAVNTLEGVTVGGDRSRF